MLLLTDLTLFPRIHQHAVMYETEAIQHAVILMLLCCYAPRICSSAVIYETILSFSKTPSFVYNGIQVNAGDYPIFRTHFPTHVYVLDMNKILGKNP